ncbi:hypothetical protein B296_00028302 [Ensete ventricosum]|uniref:Uncharacterized protein n=1 Tax=Ensete ventricosum TaxID=4639 RepID=A0A426ZND7_ENSVE|nr:hypothetical protein B296_00028302 [Ensete ventricosum]
MGTTEPRFGNPKRWEAWKRGTSSLARDRARTEKRKSELEGIAFKASGRWGVFGLRWRLVWEANGNFNFWFCSETTPYSGG